MQAKGAYKLKTIHRRTTHSPYKEQYVSTHTLAVLTGVLHAKGKVLGYSQVERLTKNYGTGERRHSDGPVDGIQVGFKHEPRSVASLAASRSLAIRAVNLALNPQLVEPAHTNQEGTGVDIVPLNADTDVTLPYGICTCTCMDAHYTPCALLSRTRARDYASYNRVCVCVCVRADRCRGAHLTVMLAPCPTCLDTSPTRWQAG